jgi:hypothetical protein
MITKNGTPLVTDTTAEYYLAPYTPLGEEVQYSGIGLYDLFVTSFASLPLMLTVGDAGPLLAGTFDYQGTPAGSLTETYSVTQNDAGVVLLTLTRGGVISGNPISQALTFSLDASGNVTLVAAQVEVNGTMLAFGSTA